MRNRSSSKSMEVEREEQPQLSGAYIRSLVKHLSHSSKAKGGHDSSMESPDNKNDDQNPTNNNSSAKATEDQAKSYVDEGGKGDENKPPPYKKQVRRRLHTTRPYQERLLNMAEARREIVTALKVHRASMKQAKEKQQQQQQILLQQQLLQQPQTLIPSSSKDPLFEPYREFPFSYSNFSNYLCNTEVSPFAYSSFSWPQPTIAPVTPVFNTFNLDLPFPSQPLGLNLNFQGFNSIDFPLLPSQPLRFTKPITQPSQTTSSNYSHSYSSPTPLSYEPPKLDQNENPVSLHPPLDEEEIVEICSLGEKHDIEWNDTVNLVTSAWWSKFLKNLEEGEGESMEGIERHESNVLNEGNLDKPLWLDEGFGQENNGGCFDDQQLFDCYQADFSDQVALPRLDIGEIEGWNNEWLS